MYDLCNAFCRLAPTYCARLSDVIADGGSADDLIARMYSGFQQILPYQSELSEAEQVRSLKMLNIVQSPGVVATAVNAWRQHGPIATCYNKPCSASCLFLACMIDTRSAALLFCQFMQPYIIPKSCFHLDSGVHASTLIASHAPLQIHVLVQVKDVGNYFRAFLEMEPVFVLEG